jgi:hypothetical protein
MIEKPAKDHGGSGIDFILPVGPIEEILPLTPL